MKAAILKNLGLAAGLHICPRPTLAGPVARAETARGDPGERLSRRPPADGGGRARGGCGEGQTAQGCRSAGRSSLRRRALPAAYGRLARRFGVVTAVAPPTMVVLGTAAGHARPLRRHAARRRRQAAGRHAHAGAVESLSQPAGTGASDLPDPKQQSLFLALFPGGVFKVQWDRPNERNRDEDIQDLSAQIPQARLRLGQSVNLGLPVAGHPDTHTFGMTFHPAGAPKRYVQAGDRRSTRIMWTARASAPTAEQF